MELFERTKPPKFWEGDRVRYGGTTNYVITAGYYLKGEITVGTDQLEEGWYYTIDSQPPPYLCYRRFLVPEEDLKLAEEVKDA